MKQFRDMTRGQKTGKLRLSEIDQSANQGTIVVSSAPPAPPLPKTDKIPTQASSSVFSTMMTTMIKSFNTMVMFWHEKNGQWYFVERMHIASELSYCIIYKDISGIERTHFAPRWGTQFKVFERM